MSHQHQRLDEEYHRDTRNGPVTSRGEDAYYGYESGYSPDGYRDRPEYDHRRTDNRDYPRGSSHGRYHRDRDSYNDHRQPRDHDPYQYSRKRRDDFSPSYDDRSASYGRTREDFSRSHPSDRDPMQHGAYRRSSHYPGYEDPRMSGQASPNYNIHPDQHRRNNPYSNQNGDSRSPYPDHDYPGPVSDRAKLVYAIHDDKAGHSNNAYQPSLDDDQDMPDYSDDEIDAKKQNRSAVNPGSPDPDFDMAPDYDSDDHDGVELGVGVAIAAARSAILNDNNPLEPEVTVINPSKNMKKDMKSKLGTAGRMTRMNPSLVPLAVRMGMNSEAGTVRQRRAKSVVRSEGGSDKVVESGKKDEDETEEDKTKVEVDSKAERERQQDELVALVLSKKLTDGEEREGDDQAAPFSIKQLNDLYKEQLRVVPSKKAKGYEKWKLERKKDVKAFKLKVREFGFMFNLWQSSFKTIEAHFGSAVLAYFLFVKWLFLINLFTSIVIISVIVLPQAILAPQTFNDSIHIQDHNTSHTVFVEDALSCSLLYKDSLDNYSVNAVDAEVIIDFFQGTGWMENTPLFIGFYFNKVYMYEDDRSYYNMPLGYILATFSYMLVALITMVQYTAEGMRSRVTTSGDRFYHSCNTIFCGWDSSLTEEKAANFKHKNLYAEYLNDLAEMRQAEARKSMTTSQVAKVYFVRFVVWVITLVILGAAGYLIYRVVAIWMPQLLAQENVINSGILKLLVEFLPSITMTVINILIPPVFIKMIDFEGYAPETEISVTISRTVILRVASLAVLLITLAIQITSCDIKCGTCEGVSMCWETYVGQQIYKLVILDLLVIPAMTLLVEFPRRLLVKRFPDNKLMKLVGLQEFDIPRNVLDIVYTQTICWIGGFFSPLIPVITVMKLFIFFYVKKVSLLKNLIPASRVYRASRASHFFMIILMVAFVMCTGAITYAMGRINPSQGCGPFRIYTTEDYYMFDTLYDAIQTLPSIVRDILNILGHWAFYVALVVILFLVIYYYKAVAGGNKYLASLLEEQLALEGKDRQFLLMRVNEALNLA